MVLLPPAIRIALNRTTSVKKEDISTPILISQDPGPPPSPPSLACGVVPVNASPRIGSRSRQQFHRVSVPSIQTTNLEPRSTLRQFSPLSSNPGSKPSNYEEPLRPTPSPLVSPSGRNSSPLDSFALKSSPLFHNDRFENVPLQEVSKRTGLPALSRAQQTSSFAAELDNKSLPPVSPPSTHQTAPPSIHRTRDYEIGSALNLELFDPSNIALDCGRVEPLERAPTLPRDTVSIQRGPYYTPHRQRGTHLFRMFSSPTSIYRSDEQTARIASRRDGEVSLTKRDAARYCVFSVLTMMTLLAFALGASALYNVQNFTVAPTNASPPSPLETWIPTKTTLSTMESTSGSTDTAAQATLLSTTSSSHTKTQSLLRFSSQGQGASTTSTARSSTRQFLNFSESESDDLFRRLEPVTRRQGLLECPDTTTVTVTITTTFTVTALPPAHTGYTLEVSSQVSKRSIFNSDDCTNIHSADALTPCKPRTFTSHVASVLLKSSSRAAPASSNVAGRRYVAPLA